jgi:hypothetical protein
MIATDLPPLIRDCVDAEVSPITAGEARARAILAERTVRHGPARPRSRRGAAATVAGLTAAAAAVALGVVTAALPAGAPGGARGGRHAVALRLPARQILLTAATAAAASTARTGSYWYVRMTTTALAGKEAQRTWTRPGGKTWVRGVGLDESVLGGRGKGRRQFSLAGYDWMFAQNPRVIPGQLSPWMRRKVRDPGWAIVAVVGRRRWLVLGPGQQAALRHGAGYVSFRRLQRLPASPAGLQTWLRAFERNFTKRTGVPTPEPGALIQSLTELVAGLPAPPQVRAAAFRVLATLPNVTSLGRVHGGQALRISLGGNTRATLIVDPSTSRAWEVLTVSYGPGPHSSSSVAVSARWVNWRP